MLSTEECCHIFHSRQKWKQQVLQNPFFLSLDWAVASFLQKALISVQYCKSWEAALFTRGIKEIQSLAFQLCHQLFSSSLLPVLLTAFYRHYPDGNTATYFQIHYLSMTASGIPVPRDSNCLQPSNLTKLWWFKNSEQMTQGCHTACCITFRYTLILKDLD